MYASFTTLVSMQVDPSKKFEVFGNYTYDELGQRIATVEAVDVQEKREAYKELFFYKTVSVHQYTKLSVCHNQLVVGVASIGNDSLYILIGSSLQREPADKGLCEECIKGSIPPNWGPSDCTISWLCLHW